ncbi:MAG TPA: OsmC family protein [Vicinamibacterales bacterium]
MSTGMIAQKINGVDVEAFERLLETLKNDPRTAAFQFRSSTKWKDGAVVASTFAGYRRDGLHIARPVAHTLASDEPPALLGTGTAVGPTGHLLHALSHSLAVAMVYYGAAQGIEIEALNIDAEGTLDLQGLLGLDERVKPGFKQIHLNVRVDSPCPPERIRRLLQYAQGRSPVWQTVSQPVSIDWRFDIDATDAPADTGDVRHGVDMNRLTATVAAIQESPVLARCRFYTSAEWQGGAQVKSTNPGFDQAEGPLLIEHRDTEPKGYLGDQVPELLGSDKGVAPEEALLQAMAGCVSVTTSYHAAARGIRLEAFDVDFESDVDMQGFGDLDDRVIPGFQQVRGRVYIKAGGSEQALRELLEFTTAHSPMCNSVAKPVQITCSLTCNGQPA